ncbi:hypothetical protein [Paracoccus ravus]|uniref:hypothetical protein n=1 Tax=Paracoccus ravus TaxID=2447760 RepID=UPI00106E558D|nr:hypothetical protein [Paracoccus ravus]
MAIQKAAFDIRLQGFPAANRDATIKLTNQVTGAVIERKPFLDGQLLLRDLDPGPYQLSVTHPNLISPIEQRIIRLIPQPFPTRVPVPVPPDLFRDTPIQDIPDADLAPVQQTAATVAAAMGPISGKAAGEVIRADDWNTLVSAVSDLARAVGELTRLVAPIGHNHPEIETKIGEVQGNIRRFADSFGRSLVALRRDLENQNLRQNIRDVLTVAGQDPDDLTNPLNIRIRELEEAVVQPTPNFTSKLAATGSLILKRVNEIALERDDPDTFLATPQVSQLLGIATQYSNAGPQITAEEELNTYQRTTAVGGPTKFGFARS